MFSVALAFRMWKRTSLALFDSHGLPVTERLSVDREPLVADLPSIRLLLLFLLLLRLALEFFVLFFLHLFRPEEWLELVSREKHLLVESAGIVFRLDIDECE